MASVLYLSYDGLLEPLGQSQVLSYLERLAGTHRITLITYEKAADWNQVGIRGELAAGVRRAGIRWIALRYHKRPSLLATALDLGAGIAVCLYLTWFGKLRIVHARSYVPAVLGLLLKKIAGCRFIFDMRGFWADEKVGAGQWSRNSLPYRLAKALERQFFEQADVVISLTEDGLNALKELGYQVQTSALLEVIPTCADLDAFRPGPRDAHLEAQLGLAGHLVIGCVGTMSNWYLRREMLECLAFLTSRLEGSRVLVVTREDHEQLRKDAAFAGLSDEELAVTAAPFDAMPSYMRMIDLGFFLIRPGFSKRGSAATKLAEFLASGVPVLINDGVGDSGRVVRRHAVGVALPEPTVECCRAHLDEIKGLLTDPRMVSRCRATAESLFSLDVGVQEYDRLYKTLARQT